jgi:hypothetical protein
MNPRILFSCIAGGVLASAAALALVVYATTPDTALDAGAFPTVPQSNLRIELRSGEQVRNVQLYPDGVTARRAVAEKEDGSISTFVFHPDGKPDTLVVESAADEKGDRRTLRQVKYAPDGRTLAHDVEFNQHGVLIKEALLTDPKLIKRSYFFDSGELRKAQSIVLEYQGWILRDETVMRIDRTLARTLISGNNGAFVDTAFAEDGTRVVSEKKLTASYGVYTEVLFADDGVTRLREVRQDTSETTLAHNDSSGKLIELRKWSGEVGKGSLFVDYYDQRGKLVYNQWWNTTKDGKYVLWLYREYRDDATQSRQVIFANDGRTVEAELLYDGDGRTMNNYTFLRRKYRADGTLETEEDVVQNKTLATRTFPESNDRRIDLDPKRLELGDFSAPPQVVPYSPPGPG